MKGTKPTMLDMTGDSEGKIDFEDFLEFGKLAGQGGIPTMEYAGLLETARQFDINNQTSIDQLNDQINSIVSENGLNRAQERFLTLTALSENRDLQNAGIDMEHMANLVDLLDSDGADFFSIQQVQDIKNAILDGTGVNDVLRDLNDWDIKVRNNVSRVQGLFDEYFDKVTNDLDAPQDFLGIVGATSMLDWYDTAVDNLQSGIVNRETRESWIAVADMDGDGDITPLDRYAYQFSDS